MDMPGKKNALHEPHLCRKILTTFGMVEAFFIDFSKCNRPGVTNAVPAGTRPPARTM